jgi:hypothetical protein
MIESDEGKNATITDKKPSGAELRFIEDAVKNNIMFKKLGIKEMRALLGNMEHYVYESAAEVVKEG